MVLTRPSTVSPTDNSLSALPRCGPFFLSDLRAGRSLLCASSVDSIPSRASTSAGTSTGSDGEAASASISAVEKSMVFLAAAAAAVAAALQLAHEHAAAWWCRAGTVTLALARLALEEATKAAGDNSVSMLCERKNTATCSFGKDHVA
jgi:hypothetical protein